VRHARSQKREANASATAPKAPRLPANTQHVADAKDAGGHEADRVANDVTSGGAARRHWSLSETRMAADSPLLADASQDAPPVRIHTDEAAAQSAEKLNTDAYTSGRDIFFAEGQLAPSTKSGRKLLAHELTHTVQSANASNRPAMQSDSVADLEREADQVSVAVANGHRPPAIQGVAQSSTPPLKAPPDTAAPSGGGGATFGNLFQDQPAAGFSFKVVELKQIDGVWYEQGQRSPQTRASGSYDFVVQDGRILGVKSKGDFGHTEAAGGGRVSYAGQVEFGGPGGKRGVVTRWSNASGHYAPPAGFNENAIKAGMPADKFVRYSGPKGEMGPQLPVYQPGTQEGQGTPAAGASGGGKTASTQASAGAGEPAGEGSAGAGVKPSLQSEEEGGGGRPRRIGGGLEAGEPGFTRSLGFAALSFGAGIGTSLLQGAMREKILNDLAKLPKPRIDRRGASEFLKDPATGPAVSLLDVLGKDIKAFIAAFQPQHDQIMSAAQFKLLAIALLPSKSSADLETRFAQLDPLSDEMSAYEEQVTTVQSNLAAMLSQESKAMQTKAAADDLIAKLPSLFAAQNVASAMGVGPSPEIEDYAAIDSNLRYISASIGIAFAGAHAAKQTIDKAVDQVAKFRSDLHEIWLTELAAQLASLSKEKGSTSAPAAKPPRPPAQAHETPPGVKLTPAPQGFPSLEEQRGTGKCPTCHDQNKEKDESHMPQEYMQGTMSEEQLKEWIKQNPK
jgi:Domain of unknown function (DUF4157)